MLLALGTDLEDAMRGLLDGALDLFGSLFDLIEYGDPGSTLLLIGILLVVGRVVSGRRPEATQFAKRAAGLAFVLYLALRGWGAGSYLEGDFLSLALGGALAAGLLGSAALISYSGLHFLWSGLWKPGWRMVSQTVHALISLPIRTLHWMLQPFRRRQELAAIEREKPAREAIERTRLAAETRAHRLESRRDKLRYDLRLRFRSLEESLTLLDEDQFESMLETTLEPDSQAEINRRIKMLNDLLESFANEKPPQSLVELAAHFRKLRKDVENSPLPDVDKRRLLKWYTMQEKVVSERFIKEQR